MQTTTINKTRYGFITPWATSPRHKRKYTKEEAKEFYKSRKELGSFEAVGRKYNESGVMIRNTLLYYNLFEEFSDKTKMPNSNYISLEKYCNYYCITKETIKNAINRNKINYAIVINRRIYLDITKEYIGGHLKYLKLLEEIESIFTKTQSITETAKEMNLNTSTVRNYLKEFRVNNKDFKKLKSKNKGNHKYTDIYEEIIEMYLKIKSYKKTAIHFNIACSTIQYIIKKRKPRNNKD